MPTRKTDSCCSQENVMYSHFPKFRITAYGSHGSTRTSSLGGRKYILVIVDDYSQYTWALLLREKFDAFEAAQQLFKKIQIEQNCPIMRIRSDHGREFENARFEEFCWLE